MENEFLASNPKLVELVADYLKDNDKIGPAIFQRKLRIGYVTASALINALIKIDVVKEVTIDGVSQWWLIRENLAMLDAYIGK